MASDRRHTSWFGTRPANPCGRRRSLLPTPRPIRPTASSPCPVATSVSSCFCDATRRDRVSSSCCRTGWSAPTALSKGDTADMSDLGISVQLTDFTDYTLLIAKRDPGQGLIWLALLLLISGITITFYLPRRRVWARLASDGRLAIVWRSDRYVDVEREFGRLLDDLV